MEHLNILVADDHQIMRDGISSILKEQEEINHIYEAATGEEALKKCREKEDIDIVLLDISMPDMNGIEAAEKIKNDFPDLEIIALSMMKEEESIRNMLRAGASAYVLKSAGKPDLIQAIRNIREGKPFYSEEVTFQIMKKFKDSESAEQAKKNEDLTNREIEILQLIAEEYTNQEIADKLYISKRTVDTHRTNLLRKTNSKNTAGLVRYAIKNDLV